MNNSKTIFILEPHMDDGFLGCAGVLSNITELDNVYLITLVDHDNPVRINETIHAIETARSLYNNDSIHHISLDIAKDGNLDIISRKEILSKLDNLSYMYNPNYLYIPYPSSHQDHEETYKAGISLSRVDYKHFIPNVYLYEPYLPTWSPSQLVFSKKYNILSDKDLENKLKIISNYKSQIDNNSHKLYSLDAVKDLAQLRGRECNANYAECYHILREVI